MQSPWYRDLLEAEMPSSLMVAKLWLMPKYLHTLVAILRPSPITHVSRVCVLPPLRYFVDLSVSSLRHQRSPRLRETFATRARKIIQSRSGHEPSSRWVEWLKRACHSTLRKNRTLHHPICRGLLMMVDEFRPWPEKKLGPSLWPRNLLRRWSGQTACANHERLTTL